MTCTHLIALTTPALDGGIGRNILNLAGALCGMGYKVHLLIDKPKGPYLEQLHPSVKVVPLPTSHPFTGTLAMGRYLWRHRPDAVLTPNVRHTALALNARRITAPATRIYVNIHNTYSKTFQNLSPQKKAKRLKKINTLYPRCDGIIPVSQGVAEDLCRFTNLSPALLTPIYNPVVSERLERLAVEPVTHPWFRGDEPPIILSVSRLEKAKNLTLLIEAYEKVRKQLHCRLAIIGSGSQHALLEAKVERSPYREEITLLGHQSNPYKYMKRSSLFVLSSLWEGFGNVLVEAMAVGTPVVSTDCPHGPREILENGRLGPLVPVGDSEALANGIRQALLSPLPAPTLKRSAERFRDTLITKRYLQLFGLSNERENVA